MLALQRAKGGGMSGGGILEVVAWQPDLLSSADKGAQATHLALVVCTTQRAVLTVLWVTPKPPASWGSCNHMPAHARSCWFHVL